MGKKVVGLVLADRSGSMSDCLASANTAINSFFKERSEAATTREEWALDHFNERYNEVFGFTDVAAVPVYQLHPRGMTALHDSIAQSVKKLSEYKPDKNKLRILVIVTDGYENSSKEHNAETIKKIIDSKKAAGWQIIYLGANQDAVMEATKLGIKGESSLTYNTENSSVAMSAVSRYVTSGVAGQGWGFTAHERDAAVTSWPGLSKLNLDSVNHEDGSYI